MPFDPREAALQSAFDARRCAEFGAEVAEQTAAGVTAVVCGLVYVGDQMRAATMRPSALQVVLPNAEAVAAWVALSEPEHVGRWVDALRSIANYEESFGGPPPDDAMREIAVKALRGDDHVGAGE